MTKKLDTKEVMSELSGSAYFGGKKTKSPTSPVVKKTPTRRVKAKPKKKAIVLSSYRDSTPSNIENIRKCVKELGKEATFLRLTEKEKRELTDIVYNYKRDGFKTSDNEVLRIALQFLIAEYRANGKQSTLNKVLEALKA